MSRLRCLLILLVLAGLAAGGCESTPGPYDWEKGAPEVIVYFVRANDSGIWVEPEIHLLDRPSDENLRERFQLLFTGRPHDWLLGSAAPTDVEVLSVELRDGVVFVDVDATITTYRAASAQEVAFAQQLAHSASGSGGDAVQLLVDGETVDELWGHLDWSLPIEPDPYALSPITIVEPEAGPGELTVGPDEVVVRGEARVFEATFTIRLHRTDGAILAEDVVTASDGAPERGTWEHTFTLVGMSEPGAYTIEVQEHDASDGEGRPPFVSSRQINVGT